MTITIQTETVAELKTIMEELFDGSQKPAAKKPAAKKTAAPKKAKPAAKVEPEIENIPEPEVVEPDATPDETAEVVAPTPEEVTAKATAILNANPDAIRVYETPGGYVR